MKGQYKNSPEQNKKISIARMGTGNGMYKASTELKALHIYMHHRIPKPNLCQSCNKNKSYDLANISQLYKREVSDWEWLCRKCHMIKDGRLNKFVSLKHISWNKGKKQPPVICLDCGKLREHKAKGLCSSCYKRLIKGYKKRQALEIIKNL